MSRYDLFRKRLAPVAFGLAIVLIARDSCNAEKRTHATVVFELGPASKAVGLDADLVVGQDTVGTFHADATDKRVLTYDISLPNDSGDGEMQIDLTMVDGTHAKTNRHFRAAENSTVTIPLIELTH